SGDKFAPVCDINTYLSERPDMSGNAADEVAVYAEGPAHAAGLFNVRITESSIGTRSFMTAPPNAYAGAAGYAGSPYYRVM
ncbi:MAG: hypothetical protein LBE48_00670, partial [Methanomassiliicoccaceae archaeon]|nr:hypothetical protein [Methanomassiliicoccaceae archaeon]